MSKFYDELKSIFEYELKIKLSLKASSSNSEMSLLNNTFKFFDDENSGLITKEKWPNILKKLGLVGFTDEDLNKIFDYYDKYQTGLINYKNFTNYIFGEESFNPIKPYFFSEDKNNNNNDNLMNKKYKSHKRRNSLNNNSSNFKKIFYNYNDDNDNKTINNNNNHNFQKEENYHTLKKSFSEKKLSPQIKQFFKILVKNIKEKTNVDNGIKYFTLVMKIKEKEDNIKETITFEDLYQSFLESNIILNKDLLKDFFSILDLCDLNSVSTNEILRLIKDNLSEKRKNLITYQFNKINLKKEQWINTIYLKSIYNSEKHPEVISGRKNKNEIFSEFSYTLDIYLSYKKRDNQINLEDFLEYYSGISSSIDNDDYFEKMIKGVWDTNEFDDNNNLYLNDNVNKNLNINYKPQIVNQNNNNKYQNLRYDNNYYYNNTYGNHNKFLSKSHQNRNIKLNNNNSNNNINQYTFKQYPINNSYPLKNDLFSKNFYTIKNNIRYNPIINKPIYPEKQQINLYKKDNLFNRMIFPNSTLNNYINYNNNIINYMRNNISNKKTNYHLLNKNNPLEYLNIFRNILASRGSKAIFNFQKIFIMYDIFLKGEIDFQSFESICHNYKINLSDNQLYSIFSFFLGDNSKKIAYKNLFKYLIGNMNISRANLIKSLFDKLNKNIFNQIDLLEIKGRYNSKNHPEVLSRNKTEKEEYNEFIDNLEIYKNYLNIITHSNKISFTFEEFLNFFNQISLGIKDDQYFFDLINKVWDLNNENNNNNIYYNNNNNYYYYNI